MTAASLTARYADETPGVTLLELVQVLCEITPDDAEVVATVREMLRSGRLRLCGNFRGRETDLL